MRSSNCSIDNFQFVGQSSLNKWLPDFDILTNGLAKRLPATLI